MPTAAFKQDICAQWTTENQETTFDIPCLLLQHAQPMFQAEEVAELSRHHSQSVPALNQYHSGHSHYVELNQIRYNKQQQQQRLSRDSMFGQVGSPGAHRDTHTHTHTHRHTPAE